MASLKITQIKSTIGALKKHRACVAGLGLRRIGHSVELADTPAIRGMAAKVSHLIRVEQG